jgi:hypothetical protein
LRPAVEERPPRPGDAQALAAAMRPADVDEVRAVRGAGCDLAAAVQEAIDASACCWAIEVGGELALIAGVVPVSMLGDMGVAWALGTPVVDQQRRALSRRAPAYIDRMLAAFPHLVNAVDERNVRAVRWLRRAGFTLHAPVPGPGGLQWIPFEMRAPHV